MKTDRASSPSKPGTIKKRARGGSSTARPKPPVGGRSKKSPARTEAVLYALRLGCSFSDAAKLAGIHRDTLLTWRANDVDFAAQCEVALIAMEIRLLEQIDAASKDPKHWQAAAWRLERAFPERYARPHRLEVTGKAGGPVNVDARATLSTLDERLESLTIDELKALANANLPGDAGP